MSGAQVLASSVGEAFQPRRSNRTHFSRFYEENRCHHVVSSTLHREPIFTNEELADVLFRAIQFLRPERAFVLAYVVMPDHFHALVVPRSGRTVSDVMHTIKGYSARVINRRLGRRGALWQHSFYDRMIRNENELRETIAYIQGNPVVAGLAETPEEYRFSSAGRMDDVDVGRYL